MEELRMIRLEDRRFKKLPGEKVLNDDDRAYFRKRLEAAGYNTKRAEQ